MRIVTQRGLLAAALLACLAAPASARNDKMLLQIGPALSGAPASQAPGASLPVRFGSATAAAADPGLGMVEVRGVADPYGPVNNNSGGARQRRTDEVVCADAFRKAVADLQQQALRLGAVAVVGVVSNYKTGVLDSRDVFECRIGHSRGFVDLKGGFARTLAN